MQTRKRKAAIVRRRAPKSKAIVRREPSHLDPRAPALTASAQLEKVLILGDLATLTAEERIDYYKRVCQSLGLNTLTRPFDYILFREFDDSPAKLALYANKSCTEQLRKIHGVGVIPPLRRTIDETRKVVMVEADVRDRTGKTDTATGLVSLTKYSKKNNQTYDLRDREYCNAIMKCETKAKRRATLSICGLAFLDESELDNMKIIGGVTPDGRIYHFPEQTNQEVAQLSEEAPHGHAVGSDKARMADEALKRVEAADLQWKAEQEKKKDKESAVDVTPSKKYVEPKPTPPNPNWPTLEAEAVNPNEFIIRGDISGKLFPMIEFSCKWDRDWWRCDLESLQKMQALQQREGFNLTILQAAQPAKKEKPATKTPPSGTAGSKPPAGAVSEEVVTGVIQDYWEKMTKGVAPTETSKGRPSVPFLRLLFKKLDKKTIFVSTYDKPSFKALIEAKDRQTECRFRIKIKGDYIDMLEIQKLGKTEYHEGVPVIQRGQQEAGGKTLF